MEKRISDLYDPGDPSERSPELEYELQRARDRMRYVDPKTCGKILGHDRYWTRQFLARYLDRCDAVSFDRPSDGYALARHVPELARRIRVGSDPRYFDSEREKASAVIWALSVQGSACRAAQELGEAELAFQRALDFLKGNVSTPEAVAELERRYAAYLAIERYVEAEKHLERSLEICRRCGYQAGEADALALRGYVALTRKFGGAVPDFVRSMQLADTGTARGKRTYSAGLHNLTGMVLVRGKRLREQESAVLMLQKLKEDMKGRSLSVRKNKLVWIEGLMLGNLGIDRHAERQLRKAREGFIELQQPVDFVLSSLDLAYLLCTSGEAKAAEELGDETYEALRGMTDEPKLLKVVRQWPLTATAADVLYGLRQHVAEKLR